MPVKVKAMSAVEVKRLVQPGRHAVGGVSGLCLKIASADSRSWVLRTNIGGRRADIGLGAYPDTSLAQAREKARVAKDQIAQGIDPIQLRRDARDALRLARASHITFDEAATKYLTAKAHEFRNPKHVKQWQSTLATYASPVIGEMPVSDIELAYIVRILEPIWASKTETASRLRGRIEAVLAWATVHGYRTGENPARWKGHLDAVLAKPSKVKRVKHHKALPFTEVGAFMASLRQRDGMAARCLEFAILTASRSNEARGARWSEVDLTAKVWIVPADRMKAGREHRVPLSGAAVSLLESLPMLDGADLVFPAPRGGVMSENTLGALIKRMGYDCTAHGFRSTFRDWCSERTSYPHEIAEMALAHTIKNKAEAAYRRGDLLAKRAHLMADWSRYCSEESKPAEVIDLERRVGDSASRIPTNRKNEA